MRNLLKWLLVPILLLAHLTVVYGQNPAGIDTQPLLWLKADAGVTLSKGKVSSWQDQSRSGKTLTQSNLAKAPVLSTLPNSGNKGQAIFFDGIDDVLLLEGGLLGNQSFSEMQVFFVSQTTKSNVHNPYNSGSGFREITANSGRFGSHIPWSDNTVYFDFGQLAVDGRVSTPIQRKNEYEVGVFTFSLSASEKSIKYNNGVLSTGGGGRPVTGGGNNFFLGAMSNETEFTRMYLSEMIVFPKVLSPNEENAVYNYLDRKYQVVSQSFPITALDNFTLRRNVPDHYSNDNWGWDQSTYEEWVYWNRTGPNHWQVQEKMNMRIMRPENYDPNRAEGYPVMFFFAGCGGSGGKANCEGTIDSNASNYENNSSNIFWIGTSHQSAIRNGSYNGFVVALQGDYSGWENGILNEEPSATMATVHKTIEAVIEKFNIDRNRVVTHGLSNGAKAVWDLINRRPDLIAGALPMSGVGNSQFFPNVGHMPIWHFQGEVDQVPPASASRNLRNYFDANGGNLRYLEYAGVGHGTWIIAYQNPEIFSWMSQQDQRNIHVFHGQKDIPTAGGSITLGIAPNNQAYKWYRDDELIASATSNKHEAKYGGNYKVKWQRFNGEWETSFVTTLTGPTAPTENTAPVASAGADQTITLPVNSVFLEGTGTDQEGAIALFEWTQVSGPNSAIISNPNQANTEIKQLVVGTYTFQLTVTDSEGLKGIDNLEITVKPEEIVPGDATPLFYINVGGTDVSSNDVVWEQDKRRADHEYFTGNSYSTSWNGCGTFNSTNNQTDAPNEIFCPYRLQPSWGTIKYSFPVANGTYTLDLYFAERNFDSNGQRKFDVLVENEAFLESFDIHAEVGKNVAIKKSITLNVADGLLNIELERGIGDPVLNGVKVSSVGPAANRSPVVNAGIDQSVTLPENSVTLSADASDADGTIISYEWVKISGPAATIASPVAAATQITSLVEGNYVFRVTVVDNEDAATTDDVAISVRPEVNGQAEPIYRINAGGSQITDDPISWDQDQRGNDSPYLRSVKTRTTGWNFNNTDHTTDAPGTIFGTQRYQPSWGDKIAYEFPVSSGTYDLRLYFAEKPGSNIVVGARQFDISIEDVIVAANYDIAAAVGKGGDMKEYQVVVADDELHFELINKVGYPVISGIEILSYSGAAPPPLEVEENQVSKLVLYPNPVSDRLTVDYLSGEDDRNVQVKIYDNLLHELMSVSTETQAGESSLFLDLGQLSSGVYFLQLGTSSFPRQVGKFVVE